MSYVSCELVRPSYASGIEGLTGARSGMKRSPRTRTRREAIAVALPACDGFQVRHRWICSFSDPGGEGRGAMYKLSSIYVLWFGDVEAWELDGNYASGRRRRWQNTDMSWQERQGITWY